MKGMMVRGVAGLAVALGMAACTNDDTVNAGGDFNTVQANPAALFVSIGDSTEVLVRLVDDLDRSTPTKFTVSNVGAGIAVNYDPRYRPDYTQGDTLVVPEIKPQQRYYVVGTANGSYEFTLTSGGASTTVRVYVTPDNLGPALSATTGVAGQLITITAPSGTRFNTNSVVTFPTGTGVAPFTAFVTARAADGSTITVLVNPNTFGRATVTNVTYLFAPAAPAVVLLTADSITVPQLNIALSATTAAAGQTVTITAPGALRFSQTSAVTFASGAVIITNRAADGTTISFLVGPGVGGVGTVTGLSYPATPTAPALTLTTPSALVSPPLSTTTSNSTPNLGQSFTIALGNNFRFSNTSKVRIGGVDAGIIALSADSSTATVVALLGTSGVVTYTDLVVSNNPSVKYALASNGSIITPTATFGGTTLAGGTDIATAPLITLPTVVGQSTVVTDQGAYGTPAFCGDELGGDTCRVYQVVVPAGQTFTVTGRWSTGADIGLYRVTAGGAFQATIADALGQGATSQPENGSFTNLAAGTYYIAVAYYGPCCYAPPTAQPATLQLKITRTA